MRIKLAGFNMDIELVGKLANLTSDVLTPETISAAYARISRDPRPVDELRQAAIDDVIKARASNEQIVFGLGHASVAEHAVFNFDIMGVSRLAIEAVEHARLVSFTEKSQRYVKLGEEFVMPQEVVEAGLAERFRTLVAEQHMAYIEIFKAICDYLLSKAPGATKEEQKAIEGRAKEDARYVTSLAIEGQLGMTCNARNLEHMIRRLLCHPLHEAKTIGALLYSEAHMVAPSLLRYLEPTRENLQAMLDLRKLAQEVSAPVKEAGWPENGDSPVRLLSWDDDADVRVMAALIHTHTGLDIDKCEQCVCCLEPEQEGRLLQAVFGSLQSWDAVPRAFELADFQYELAVSASCFAQLKRHRMATLLPQGYDPFLGYTVPSSVLDSGMEDRFKEIMDASAAMCGELRRRGFPSAAPYALTQAHRRRVVVKMNARELYHFSRLRQDRHAQWDIRAVADLMVTAAKKACPLTMSLACGKDEFESQKAAALAEET